jgi:hypothetical protein
VGELLGLGVMQDCMQMGELLGDGADQSDGHTTVSNTAIREPIT